MLNEDNLNPAVEKPITDEFRAQKTEGKRRQRIYEGIDLERLSTVGGCVGTHQLPAIEEVEKFWGEGEVSEFALYPHDPDGLAREISDLERDAEGLRRHEQVNYFPEKDK